MTHSKKTPTQITGNIGLYYICYQLSKLGWNVLPTSRNARGVDIIIYSQDGKRKHTVQVKTLSKQAPLPLGNNLENFIALGAHLNSPLYAQVSSPFHSHDFAQELDEGGASDL